MFGELSTIQQIVVWILPVMFAITLHEAAHGWVALQCGDTTAFAQGRVTLNPIKHIDPIGTIALPLLLIALNAGFVFGWAKPVPINWRNLRQPRRDVALVSAAGPAANLLMALFWALIIKLGTVLSGDIEAAIFLVYAGVAGIMINLVLMALNLLPILPLDGGRVLCSLLPARWAIPYARTEPYGFFVLILLLLTNILSYILTPMIQLGYGLIGFLISA